MDARNDLRLTLTLRLVLASLFQSRRPLYGYEIAKASGLEINAVLGSLHRLETASYAKRVVEPADVPRQDRGRSRLWFELTPEGRDFAATTIEVTQQIVRSQAQSIGLDVGGAPGVGL